VSIIHYKIKRLVKLTSLLVIVVLCIFEFIFNNQSGVFREFEAALLSLRWMLLVCLGVWCGTIIFLTFSLNDLPLIGLLLVTIIAYSIGYAVASWEPDAIVLLAGVTLGRGTRFVLVAGGKNNSETLTCHPSLVTFLFGLVVLLTFASWWHLDMPNNFYHGPRWMGFWDNPNTYGLLMGAGLTLAIGLLPINKKAESGKRKAVTIFLLVATVMMSVGLIFSYSRGAWVGTASGVLYLAREHGKLRWRLVLLGICLVTALVFSFWQSTVDTDAWYLKRLDLSRPSAQHRVSAWHGAVQMMRDHPLGVGWNRAVDVYDKDYSPPEDGAGALTMNSYLMLGTELGLPGLLCFVGYIWLCFRRSRPRFTLSRSLSAAGGEEVTVCRETVSLVTCHLLLQTACRAGTVTLLVAFWFDGGLFTMGIASVFWILLELGTSENTFEFTEKAEF
jgi:O-Antigen ligase